MVTYTESFRVTFGAGWYLSTCLLLWFQNAEFIRKKKRRFMWSRRNVEASDLGGGSSWLPPGLLPSGPNQSRVPAIYAISIITCLLAAIFVGTRLYVNIRFKLPLRRDFWAILSAGIFTWAAGGLGIWGCTLGLGRHSGDIPSSNYDILKNVGIAIPTMTSVAASSAQCSILFFYLKSLSMSHSHRIITYVVLFICVLFCLVRVVSNTYHCHPNPAAAVGTCIKFHRLWYAIGVIIMALDLIIWSLPIPPLLKSAGRGKMSQGISIGVVATLGVGLLACIATMVRIVAIKSEMENTRDLPWHSSLVFMLDQLEIGLGITAACMPSLRRLIGPQSPGDDQARHRASSQVLSNDLGKESGASDLADMWMRDTIPPPPPRRFGGAIHFGPRGHLDLDIEGLGVLDSRLSGSLSQWQQQQNIEMNNMKSGTTGEYKADAGTSNILSGTAPSTITKPTPMNSGPGFVDDEVATHQRRFSLNRRGTGGSSILTQQSSPDLEKYFPGSSSSKSPLRRSLSEEVLVPSANNTSCRDQSSDRATSR